MLIGKRYRDSMDGSRTVTPVSEDGTCRVHCDGVYVGKAKVPPRLFDLDPGTDRWPGPAVRYGFVIDDGRVGTRSEEDNDSDSGSR